MDFKKFAYNSVTRNFKYYLGYYFSCTVSVMLFFMFAMSAFRPAVANMGIESNSAMGIALTFTESIITCFSLLFIIYSLGTFVKSRYRELGTLMILGMSDKQFKKLLLLENLIIGLISIISGIVLGFLLAKPFLMLISDLFEVNATSLYIPTIPILLTSIVFIILFTITSPVIIKVIKNKDIIELLNGDKKPKKEPNASIILSILSIILVLGGYIAIILQVEDVELLIFASLTIGTYIFFTQFSVLFFKKLKENKKLYLNKTNVLWISNMVYKVKDNSRLLFLTSILLSITLVSISALSSSVQSQLEQSKEGFPFAVFYMSSEDNKIKDLQVSLIENTLKENKYKYEKTSYDVLYFSDRTYVISTSEFNKVGDVLGYEKLNVSENEAIRVPRGRSKTLETHTFNIVNKDLVIAGNASGPLLSEGYYNDMVVVSDNLYNKLKNDNSYKVWTGYGYNYNGWEDSFNTINKLDEQRKLKSDKVYGEYEKFDYEMFSNLPDVYNIELISSKIMLFIGTFVGIIFFIGSCSFLYFRFYTDLIFDKEKYKNLLKLGLSYNEMKRVLNIEIGSIFFIPYIIATLNSIFALGIIKYGFDVPVGIKGLIVPVLFFVIYFMYFIVLKMKYIKSIAKEIPSYLD
ncbi:ABC transporter permease [Romboutsia lituseburensis]|uniref:ABC transporter permease n=1 Tax=Romboutsia lituseburensis TaxID=1537 RepID=UPI00215AB0EE|nr:ABC transporter permease [Romboutsia lituseburensis]MCR8746276.1 ABC transporter permease [Romboutsia lituseburensis]